MTQEACLFVCLFLSASRRSTRARPRCQVSGRKVRKETERGARMLCPLPHRHSASLLSPLHHLYPSACPVPTVRATGVVDWPSDGKQTESMAWKNKRWLIIGAGIGDVVCVLRTSSVSHQPQCDSVIYIAGRKTVSGRIRQTISVTATPPQARPSGSPDKAGEATISIRPLALSLAIPCSL